MLTKLILIRHGITNWNKAKRYCGRIDVRLSRQGRAQAKRLARTMQEINCDKIYTSDRKRAIETARIIFGKDKFTKIKDLSEIDFGVFEGLHYKVIMKKYPAIYRRWINDPFGCVIPKGESLNVFRKRVVRAIKKIVRKNSGKTVAVVCHGGTIAIFMSTLLKKKDFWGYVPKATSLSIVEYRSGKPKIKVFNQTNHLS